MKRILIINSDSVYVNNATGITLLSIISTIDTSKVLEVFYMPCSVKEEDRKIKGIRLYFKHIKLYDRLLAQRDSVINSSIRKNDYVMKKKSLLSLLRQRIVLQLGIGKIKIDKTTLDLIKQFAPEVIYTLGGSPNKLKLSYLLSLKFDIPIIIHHMDNWMNHIQWENNPLLRGYKKKLRKYCELCYSRSSVNLTIGDKMAEVFSAQTGINHFPLMNTLNTSEMYCGEQSKYLRRFIYAGGLHLGRDVTLKKLASTLEQNKYKYPDIEFNIYTTEDNRTLFSDNFSEFSVVKFCDYVPHENIKSVYENTDILVHVESNEIERNDFFKYSISTKIPEYLATGRPLLFFGPSNINLYHFLGKEEIAFVASTEEELQKAIDILLSKGEPVSLVTRKALKYAKEKYDIENTKKVLEMVVNSAELKSKGV